MKDLTNIKFNRLTARIFISGKWLCDCDCGNTCMVKTAKLINGHTKSCGCLHKERARLINPFPLEDLTNHKFGHWIVIDGRTSRRVLCKCVCGTIKLVSKPELKTGESKSCGCSRTYDHVTTHHRTKTKEYRAWQAMKNRCTNSKVPGYKYYGGRGIIICERWINSFENFLADMGECPSPELSLDRINVNGNYEPVNCRWATYAQQRNNTTMSVFHEYNGQVMTIKQWSDTLGIPYAKTYYKIKNKLILA